MTTLPVGLIVGPLGPGLVPSALSTSDESGRWDVGIGDLGFRLRPSDDYPYQRATAQFKKDQTDNSGQYGDQSLSGWWTRGQFSFHNGAGVKFYELTAGESVLDRFWTSDGCDVSTPGQVSLNHSFDTATTLAPALVSCTWAGVVGNGAIPVTLDDGVLREGSANTSYSPTAGTVTYACAGPRAVYGTTTSKKIERWGLGPSAPSSGALYTHTNDFLGIWWAKDRLWALDDTLTLYQLSPNPTGAPVAIGAGDKVFTAADSWGNAWALCQTPGPVLIANNDRVYSVALASDGTVPTLSGPVQVAQLPQGEEVRGMLHHLGFAVLLTTKGIRVALSDGDNFAYGPILQTVSSLPTKTTLAATGESVLVAADNTVYRVDLSRQIGNALEFAISTYGGALAGTAYGVASFASTVYAWTATSLLSTGAYMDSGTLTTGYHRFNTTESKIFYSVTVRLAGAGGTVAISQVDAGGTAISLLTVDVSTDTEAEVPIALPGPAERMALRFTLTKSTGGDTPILVGYQLRALPAPKRQRMIRLPLLLQDVEGRAQRPSDGHEGSAWERLSALEQMEDDGALVDYHDFRTGESGLVFIESIEHEGKTPPGRRDSGFGGVLWVTLRKLT